MKRKLIYSFSNYHHSYCMDLKKCMKTFWRKFMEIPRLDNNYLINKTCLAIDLIINFIKI